MKGIHALLLSLALVVSCSAPVGFQEPTSRVVFHTPYGQARSVIGGGYYQSTVIPQNLEAKISTFRATLDGGPGGPLVKTVSYAEAGEIAFDAVPAGSWNLTVSAVDAGDQEIARGTYSNLLVTNGTLTTVPGLVAVSPVREAQAYGNFDLTIRGIPADVNIVSFDYWSMVVAADGTLTGNDGLSPASDILESVLSPPLGGYRTLNIHTNGTAWDGPYAGDETGTYVLELKFINTNLGSVEGTFAPVFTIDLYQNLTSELDVTLPADTSSGGPSVQSLSVTTDVEGNAVVHWQLPPSLNYLSHVQIGSTAYNDPDPPTSGIVTIANLGGNTQWQTAIKPHEQPTGQAKFWVRAVHSGLHPSAWASLVVASNLISGDPFMYYVAPSANGGNDTNLGTSKYQPVATLQRAVDLAQARGIRSQENIIRVMAGMYVLPLDYGVLTDGTVPISIQGSWDTNFDNQDPVATPTVLVQNDARVGGSSVALVLSNSATAPFVTPITIDALTIDQTASDATTYHAIQGLAFLDLVDATVSRVTVKQNLNGASVASPLAVGLLYEAYVAGSGNYTGPTSLRIAASQFYQANGASWPTSTASTLHGVRGDDDGDPLTNLSVVNSVFSQQATTLDSIALTQLNISTAAVFRNNTFIADSPTARTLNGFDGNSYVIENNLFVNDTHPQVALLTSTSNPPTLLRNNAFANTDMGYLASFGAGSIANPSDLNGYVGSAQVSPSSVGNFLTSLTTADFVDLANGNVALQAGAGATVFNGAVNGTSELPPWSFSTDLKGAARTIPWTIGAVESDFPPAPVLVMGDGGGNDNWALHLSKSGVLWITGDVNRNGYTQTNIFNPTSITEVESMAVGAHSSYLLMRDGTIRGAGDNGHTQLALGPDSSPRYSYEEILGFGSAKQISAGGDNFFALKHNGELYFAGWNSFGESGLPDTNTRNTLTLTATDVAYVAAGYYNAAYVNAWGEVFVSGSGYSSGWHQLTTDGTTPLTGIVKASYGDSFLAMVDDSGNLWVQGNSPLGSYSYATPAGGITNVVDVSAKAALLVLQANGDLSYAGTNWFQWYDGSWQSGYGLVGTGDTATVSFGTLTLVATGAKAMAMGSNQWGYVANDDRVWTNGSNGNGGAGQSSALFSTTLTQLPFPN